MSNPVSPSSSVGHKVIKGKYLAIIENYVSTLDFNGGPFIRLNPEYDALLDAFVRLHGSFLSRENAASILFRQFYSFSLRHIDAEGCLADPSNKHLHVELVNAIKSYLESLPRKYTLQINLPCFPSLGKAIYDISESIRLVVGDEGLSFDINDGSSTVHNRNSEQKPKHATYIEIKAEGYADFSPESPAASVCISIAKQVAFILTSHRIFVNNNAFRRAKAIMNFEQSGTAYYFDIPDSLSRCFGGLFPNDDRLVVYDTNTTSGLLGLGKPKVALTPEDKLEALKYSLDGVKKYFGAQNHPDYPSISAAIEWYQDSLYADNQTVAYLTACIGLEAILGSDSHMDNMSRRLSDRFAFLMGKGRSEREAMIADYSEVLNLRGRLVHAKKARLESSNLQLLRRAQNMLLDVIKHELQELYKNI